MKKNLLFILLALVFVCGCSEEDFLNREPTDILLDEQVWKDEGLVLAVVADLYDRMPFYQHVQGFGNMVRFGDLDEAFVSRNGERWRFENNDWGYGEWSIWNYGFMRDLNLFVQRLGTAAELDESVRARFQAEGRFIRAYVYFDMVKRMGGVPLILEPMTYDFSGDPTYLQHARAKEHEIYDFIISEMEAIKNDLPDNPSSKSRATKGAALALESRAALYAGSIARYGANTPQVSLPGGEVGIPANMAEGYYEIALRAATEITGYSLYLKKPDNLEDNFASVFYDKNSNPEVIFVEDFQLQSGKVQGFTVDNQPSSMTEESFGSTLNPSLNLVQDFEMLDNTFAPLAVSTGSGDYVYYDRPEDVFANRDARLGGTVILPGSTFKGNDLDIWGGFLLEDGSIITGSNWGAQKTLPGKSSPEPVVGEDGPIRGLESSAQTGFLIRKYMDPVKGSGSLGTQSEVWWVYFRYSEVLLNAAEAAFELGQTGLAADYLNQVRARAGFMTPLAAGDVSFDRIVHERRVELAFEDHRLWDLKRWRLADDVFNGNSMTVAGLTSGLGKADKQNNQVFGLIPYKVYAPGNTSVNGKWAFRIEKPQAVTGADRFRLGNYYSYIGDDIISNNPKIVRNPNQ